MDIPKDLEDKIDEVIGHYPVSKRSAALPLLHLVQERFGYVSKDVADWVARSSIWSRSTFSNW